MFALLVLLLFPSCSQLTDCILNPFHLSVLWIFLVSTPIALICCRESSASAWCGLDWRMAATGRCLRLGAGEKLWMALSIAADRRHVSLKDPRQRHVWILTQEGRKSPSCGQNGFDRWLEWHQGYPPVPPSHCRVILHAWGLLSLELLVGMEL